MKELVKKILEAGLVEKHAALLMERWGQLDAGASDLVGRKQITVESLSKFVDEIEALVNLDATEVRETRLEIFTKEKPVLLRKANQTVPFPAIEDEMGRFIIDSSLNIPLEPGEMLYTPEGAVRQVLEVVEIYQDDEIKAWQVSVG